MGIQLLGNSGIVADVAGSNFKGLNTHVKPIEFSVGHYRWSGRIVATAAQAANSRILTLRNTGTNLLVPTRLTMRAMQITAGTAQENSLDVYKATSFTATDTTNMSSILASSKRTLNMTAPSLGGGKLNIVTPTGVAAGMTGGTMAMDAAPFATFPFMVAAAATTNAVWGPFDTFDDVNGTHPFVLSPNEGLVVVNRALNVTSYGMAWYLDISWAEVGSY